jgi:hypothetical protein
MPPPAAPFDDARIKHLEFIQLSIARLANNSFLTKGWAVTVGGALYGFAVSHLNPWIALVGLMPTLAFWWLDAYFLRAERLFRCLYDDVRDPGKAIEPFSMDVGPYRADKYSAYRKVIFSSTLRVFYGTLLLVGIVIFASSLIHQAAAPKAARTRSAVSSSTASPHASLGGQISPIRSPGQRGTK